MVRWMRQAIGWTVMLAATVGAEATVSSPVIAAAAEASAAAPAGDDSAGNRLALVENGHDALLLRVHLIRAAQRSIGIQTFIWTNDECGRLLIYELVEAARRGVKVRILADHLVSEQDPATMAFLATVHPNLEVKHYRPALARMKPTLWQKLVAATFGFRALNQRMHNKVLLVDDAVLLTGGRNVENTYFDHSTTMNFRDRDVLAVGPAVRAAASSFEAYWAFKHAVPSAALRDVGAVLESGKFRRYGTRADYDFGGFFAELAGGDDAAARAGARFAATLKPVRKAVFVADEPGKTGGGAQMPRITQALRTTLEGARETVLMQTPYLVLSPAARDLIKAMHARNPGLRIEISSNSFASTDNLFAYSANYRLRNTYVEDLGLQVHELKPQPAVQAELFPRHREMAKLAAERAPKGKAARPPFFCLHAKSLVVDGRTAFVGSYNLDPRSENLNTEAGLLVEDEAFAGELRALIERDLRPENSWVIARRPLPLKLEAVNGWIDDVLSVSPLDLWPIQNTTSYELKPGMAPVPPGHPEFYERHRDAGAFPGTEGLFTTKEILTRLYKAVGAPLTPIL
jgi:phosphatidylserine/phosphatidylglycerophosphate/cardiolipin synthase-like enzyme